MRVAPQRATAWIGATLKWGSLLSGVLMLVGAAMMMGEPERPIQVGPPMPMDSLAEQLGAGNPYAIMQVGVLLLLLTPLARLVASALSFWGEGERRYTLVSLAVLAIILVSMLLSRGG